MNEGGIASPLIVTWPNGISDRNKLRHDPCHFIDIVPTVVDLAGGATAVTGKSLAPAFRRDGAVPRDFLYFNHNDNRALRAGDWKLIATGKDGPWELYDLSRDRSEQHDLAAPNPERVKSMSALWEAHDQEYVKTREAAPPTTKQRM